jgi:hypothetical protein
MIFGNSEALARVLSTRSVPIETPRAVRIDSGSSAIRILASRTSCRLIDAWPRICAGSRQRRASRPWHRDAGGLAVAGSQVIAYQMEKSEYLMKPNVKAVPAKLIPQYGDGHLRLRLILKLNGLALGGSDVGAEG